MSNVINLNQVRKARTRVAQRKAADQNAIAYGRTKAERERNRAEEARKKALIEAQKREPKDDG